MEMADADQQGVVFIVQGHVALEIALEVGLDGVFCLVTDACGELQCDVVERLPLYENSGYTKQVAWVDQTDFQIRKVEFYDRRGDLLKVLELKDYRRYDNGVWRAHLMSMRNVQTNKQTDLVYDDYRFDIGLSEGDFVKGRLSRLR